jgi:hypothetical protein
MIIMDTKKTGITKRFFFMILFIVSVMALSSLSVMAAQPVTIDEGTYYLKAINGNAKGQVLYWNEKASDQNICMMFESCGGKNADNEVWYITKNRNFDDYYGIYLYRSYTGDKDRSKRIEMDNLTGRDQPYLTSTKGPHVFCGSYGNQDDAFRFICESGNNFYTNISIRSHDENYKFNRHKEVKLFKSDLIYVNANKDSDSSNKLWELVPVNYLRGMSKAAPSVTAKKSGKLSIKWKKFRNKIKNSKVWKKAKYIEIQCSTDKDFMKKVKSKKIKKGKINKAKAKSLISKLKKKKTYYVRVRLIDKKGVASNWSKKVKIKTKK